MKKILLMVATTSLLSVNAYAGCETPVNCWNPGSNDWYVTLSAGAQWLNKITYKTPSADGIVPAQSNKFKSAAGALINAGVGWYANEYFRTELVFTTVQGAKFKSNKKVNLVGGATISNKIRFKPKIYALMVKALFDLPLMEEFGLYAGPGIGISWIKNKSSYSSTANFGGIVANANNTLKGKTSTDLAAGAFLGVNVPIDTFGQVFLETNYTYFGKSKVKKKKNTVAGLKSKTKPYQGFGLALGMRIGF